MNVEKWLKQILLDHYWKRCTYHREKYYQTLKGKHSRKKEFYFLKYWKLNNQK